MFRIHRILHPTDFSECSRYAFRIAVDLAKAQGASVVVLHAARPLSEEQVSFGEAAAPQPGEYHERLAEAEREATADAPGVAVERVVVDGEPAHVVAQVARGRNCDLIVIGSHGRSGLQRILMGSTAERI
ncbi:MAG TPA: universal stress protein, partial [Gemmataceae bacterium]|nr:universal stress protein [Gemmataceae bacterium]